MQKLRNAFARLNTWIWRLKICKRYQNEPYNQIFVNSIGYDIVSKVIKAEIGEIIFLSYFLAKRAKSQRGRN